MAYKTSKAFHRFIVNSLKLNGGLFSQRNLLNCRFLSSGNNFRHVNLFPSKKVYIYCTKGKSTPETPSASPQLLSKLFPQTAVPDQSELEAQQEKKKREDEGFGILLFV